MALDVSNISNLTGMVIANILIGFFLQHSTRFFPNNNFSICLNIKPVKSAFSEYHRWCISDLFKLILFVSRQSRIQGQCPGFLQAVNAKD